jgi:hypothetical protein
MFSCSMETNIYFSIYSIIHADNSVGKKARVFANFSILKTFPKVFVKGTVASCRLDRPESGIVG